jgi:hypothetical protein
MGMARGSPGRARALKRRGAREHSAHRIARCARLLLRPKQQGMLLWGEQTSWSRLLLIGVIVAGTVGLRMQEA